MASERVKCKNCDNMILEITASHQNGLCGVCYQRQLPEREYPKIGEVKIPEIPLIPKPATPEAKDAIGYKYNDEAGTRHKLGGTPDFIQNDEWPQCSCGSKMTFYGQLDSIGSDYDLCDCGIIYVFVCFDCYETKSILQGY